MNVLQEILSSQNGQLVEQLGKQFGLSSDDAGKAISNLIPAIGGGIKKTATDKSGLDALLSTLENQGGIKSAIDNVGDLGSSASAQAGNEILGSIFGSKDVSRQVADQASQSTGISSSTLKKLLPVVAGLVMSSLNKRGGTGAGGLGALLGAAAASRSGGGLGNLGGLGRLAGALLGGRGRQQQRSGLESMLDFDGDGDIADDVLNLAKKLF